MYKLILSRVGGGKTTHIMNLMRDFAQNESNKITLLVPEQFRFTSVKNVLNLVGPKAYNNIDVLSFTDLGEKLLKDTISENKKRIDEPSSAVLMYMSLAEIKEQLKVYGEHSEKKSVISEFRSILTEMKQNSVTPELLIEVSDKLEDCLLKSKLKDIALVMEKYNSKIDESYFDPDDLLTELTKSNLMNEYFKNRIVFIDSFTGFTESEYEVIEQILNSSKATYITLCTDNAEKSQDPSDLFAYTKQTAARIVKLAKENLVRETKTDFLSEYSKYNNFPPHFLHYKYPELNALEQMIYDPKANKYEEKCNAITLCKAGDIYSECEFVATTAKKLIRKYGYRYRDIAVIARDINSYKQPLVSALKKCGINVFEDTRKPVSSSPVMNYLTAILNIAANGFNTENILQLLKTNLSGLSTEQISELENYCYLWKISGNKWLQEWKTNPKGLSEMTDSDYEKLSEINRTREYIILPIERFRQKIKGGTDGSSAVHALWDYFEETNVSQKIKENAIELNSQGQLGSVKELERMWNLLVDIFSKADILLKDTKVTGKKLKDIFELMLSVESTGNIPMGLDEITIGSADRIRIESPKIVFIVGANEGVFPQDTPRSSALTEKDRNRLEELGIRLSASGQKKLALERLIAYRSISCAREGLFVCMSQRSSSGDELNPGEFYLRIKEIFPKVREVDASSMNPEYYCEGKQTAFEQLAKSKEGTFRTTIKEYFLKDKEYSGKIISLQRASQNRNFNIMDTDISRELFGTNISISASKVEQYYKCPFSYFCKYGLKAMPRKIAQLDPLQRGNITHHCLESLLKNFSKEEIVTLSESEINSFISSIIDNKFKEMFGEEINDLRIIDSINRLKESITQVALRLIEDLNNSLFIPVAFELSIDEAEKIKPYTLETKDGNISIFGAIDRVDMANINGEKYFRVIDYKTGGKNFKLSDVIQGLNMQMFIYLFTLWYNGEERFGKDIIPAGVLYMHSGAPYISVKRNNMEESYQTEKKKKFKMNGIILNNKSVVNAMDLNNYGNLPVKYDSNDNPKGDVIKLNELNKLKEKCDSILLEMADNLRNGRIEAIPVHCESNTSSYQNICEYCDYKIVCQYEEDIPQKHLIETDTNSVIENLMEGDVCHEMDE